MLRATLPTVATGDLTDLALHDAAGGRVLVVGDGNFSFTRAFLRANAARVASGAIALTATSLDTHAELLRMYPSAAAALAELAAGGASVAHGVDATRLSEWRRPDETSRAFDRVVFNFPHFAAGGAKRNKIHRHRQLLCEFFASAAAVLARDGLVFVTLCAGQGGTPCDPKPRAPGDTWQVVQCAADAGLVLRDVHRCPVETLAALGYLSVGYKLRERGFWTPDSVTHVFGREAVGVPAPFPIEWTRAISFWTHEGFTEAKVAAILRASFPAPMTLRYELTDTYTCPQTGRASVTYAFTVACAYSALSKARVNARALAALRRIESSGFASSRAA
ncbi:hypothetical protein PybrP1_009388 [[Pythium] brassicae (nom. inval.)]|nr:hypothetical protein PybrP1_009388 [[Pythium] brassicae (nom. inval.)]